MSDAVARLNAALEGRCEIERELHTARAGSDSDARVVTSESDGGNTRLAAIVFAELAEFAEVTPAEGAALRSIVAFQRTARRIVVRNGGSVVKFAHVAMLAEFQSLDSAVRAAHELLRALGSVDTSTHVALQVGVHLGDVMLTEDGDVHGVGVNVAARIAKYAPLPGVVVSDPAYRHLRHRPAYRFVSLGEHELKGVFDPMKLHEVAPEGGQPPPQEERVIARTRPELRL